MVRTWRQTRIKGEMEQKLTRTSISNFRCSPEAAQRAGYEFLWDTEVPGLAVRCTAAGAKSFVFGAKLNGRDLRTTIGSVDVWDIESKDPKQPGARNEARRLRRLIDQGIDPRIDRKSRDQELERQRAEAQRGTLTLSSAWTAYIAARKASWSDLHLRDHMRLSKPGAPLAALMPLKLSDVDAVRIASWLEAEKAVRQTSARLAFALLRAFLRWAADYAEYQPDKTDPVFPYSGLAHAEACESRIVKDVLPKRRKKIDCLQKAQLRPWFTEVRKISNQTTAAYLQCVLLLGTRREELARAKWSDVDLKWHKLRIEGKTGPRVIPLPPYCRSLVDALPRVNDYVFAAVTKSGYLNSPHIAHTAALERAEIAGLTIHGLRRSFATLGEGVNPPNGVIQQVMGHAPGSQNEDYKVREIDFLREWHEKIEAWMLDQAGIKATPVKKAPKNTGSSHGAPARPQRKLS
jgi:integrase